MVPTASHCRRRSVLLPSLSLLAGALLTASCTISQPTPAPPRIPDPKTIAPAAPAVDRPARVLAGPLQARTGAWLTVGDAASRVRVRFAPLPGQLYRITTAPDAGVTPVVFRRGGRVVVRLRVTDGDGLDELRIVLNRDVRWDIRLPAGAGEQQLNLRQGRVNRVVLGSSGLAELSLPDPVGTVPVTFTGGVGAAIVTAATGAPFRIRFDQGAGSVVTPWTANNGTPAGTVLREPGYRRAADRYAIRVRSGLGDMTLRRRDPR
ncbi:hypothetical protein B0I29_105385 [Actinoplanes lutulentus]|uniref:Uncharacterized protein n=1 Tax=Actinoplanes lutulentus TaxID=1287878 RepID=A0A327ZLT1_9ACTN|nr:hypothetical protein B0I29_105385 [Actinoplanes lutulentus]